MFVRSFLSKKGQKGTRNPGQEGRGTTAKGSGLTNSGDSHKQCFFTSQCTWGLSYWWEQMRLFSFAKDGTR